VPYGDVEAASDWHDLRALPDEVEKALMGAGGVYSAVVDLSGGEAEVISTTTPRRPISSSRRWRRRVRREGGGLVRSPELVTRLHLFVHFREEALASRSSSDSPT